MAVALSASRSASVARSCVFCRSPLQVWSSTDNAALAGRLRESSTAGGLGGELQEASIISVANRGVKRTKDRMVLLPIPDPSTRVAALRSGQVDWIEYPAPDSIEALAEAGFQITRKPYPHVWAWHGARCQIGEREERKLQELAKRYGTALV